MSAFYQTVLASGLVSSSELKSIAKHLTAKDAGTADTLERMRYDISATKPISLENVQWKPKLRKTFPSPPADEPSPSPLVISSAEMPLAEELIRLGYINRWQAEQLAEGRVKFTLGKYRIFDAVGRGGYGFVFLGRETADQPFIAIKVLPISLATPLLSQRFMHEIELQKGLQHPNLVRFLESGQDGNTQYMVHEFTDGGDVKSLLRQEPILPIDIAATVVSQAARGIQYLHENGIVHRDIKPANILLSSEGTAKLIDFGLAVPIDAQYQPLTLGTDDESNSWVRTMPMMEPGRVAGTVDYMAPDQLRDPSCPTPAWDIYSLGCTLYQMLAGTVPFPDGDSQEKFRARLKSDPPDVRIFNQQVPFDMADLLRSMLTRKTSQRITSAEAVANRLDPWVPQEGFLRKLYKESGSNDSPPR